jgi:uncharacterized membrane protein
MMILIARSLFIVFLLYATMYAAVFGIELLGVQRGTAFAIVIGGFPAVLIVIAAISSVYIKRKQEKDVAEWKRANELLTDRITKSEQQLEHIERSLKNEQ